MNRPFRDSEAADTGGEKKYPIGGFAPGSYTCMCCICKKHFMGDKRAVQCEPCAEKMVAEAAEAKNTIPEGIPTEIEDWIEKKADLFSAKHGRQLTNGFQTDGTIEMGYTSGAIDMYHHTQETISALQEQIKKLTEDKPMRWVNYLQRAFILGYFNQENPPKSFVDDIADGNLMAAWERCKPLLLQIESSDPSKEIEELKAELSQVKAERDTQSTAFQKWTHHQGYRPVTDPMDPVVIYERNCSRFTVEELYEIFLKRK